VAVRVEPQPIVQPQAEIAIRRQERSLRAIQAQASTAKVIESQLTVVHIKDTKTILIDPASLDPRTCIIRIIKDEHLERSL
jgi:hypothetical protein